MKLGLTIITAAAFIWTAGIIAAPLLADTVVSDLLYRGYSVVCHQFDDRSFHFANAPFGVCIRCTAIYAGFTGVLILSLAWERLRSLRWRTTVLLVVTALPMAADGMLDLTGLHAATTVSRLVTGGMFGCGLALLLQADLSGSVHSLIQRNATRYGTEER
ncbi:MAG: DUF2085 domain-containing protein [Bacteroidetes bacterium]|nr:DUF2085 domain-containing protein [Bacteroidota bacterium]